MAVNIKAYNQYKSQIAGNIYRSRFGDYVEICFNGDKSPHAVYLWAGLWADNLYVGLSGSEGSARVTPMHSNHFLGSLYEFRQAIEGVGAKQFRIAVDDSQVRYGRLISSAQNRMSLGDILADLEKSD